MMKNDLDTIRRLQNGAIDTSYYVARAHRIRSDDAYRNARSFWTMVFDTGSSAVRFAKENYELIGVAGIFRPTADIRIKNGDCSRAFGKIAIPVQAAIHRSLAMIR